MKKGRVWKLLIPTLLLFVLDQGVKWWAYFRLGNLPIAPPFYPYGGIGIFQNAFGIDFSLNFVLNRGGAWGMLSSIPYVLLGARIVIILALAIYTFFLNKVSQRSIPLLFILVGATSNILDFFTYGAVVDLFHFVLWGYSFPVFNVADTLIFFGVASLLVLSLFEKRKCYAHEPS